MVTFRVDIVFNIFRISAIVVDFCATYTHMESMKGVYCNHDSLKMSQRFRDSWTDKECKKSALISDAWRMRPPSPSNLILKTLRNVFNDTVKILLYDGMCGISQRTL